MTPANTFYLFTVVSALFCLPLTLACELGGAAAAWKVAAPTHGAAGSLAALVFQSGFLFTAYRC